jgi:hypothetical protein
MEMLLFIIIVVLALVYVVVRSLTTSDKTFVDKIATPEVESAPSIPAKLPDLHTTTVGDRQRIYHRGLYEQLRYDRLQEQAEAIGDVATLEAIRTNTYNGRFPVLRPDGTYTNYTSEVYEFDIAGMMYRDMKKVAKCEGLSDARLVAEPTNEFDSNAIKVIHESNTHVGYIPRNDTAIVRDIVTLPANCFVKIECDLDSDYATGTVYIEK